MIPTRTRWASEPVSSRAIERRLLHAPPSDRRDELRPISDQPYRSLQPSAERDPVSSRWYHWSKVRVCNLAPSHPSAFVPAETIMHAPSRLASPLADREAPSLLFNRALRSAQLFTAVDAVWDPLRGWPDKVSDPLHLTDSPAQRASAGHGLPFAHCDVLVTLCAGDLPATSLIPGRPARHVPKPSLKA